MLIKMFDSFLKTHKCLKLKEKLELLVNLNIKKENKNKFWFNTHDSTQDCNLYEQVNLGSINLMFIFWYIV